MDVKHRISSVSVALRPRLAAICALLFALGLLGLLAFDLFSTFPRGLIVVASLSLAIMLGEASLIRTGAARALGLGGTLLLSGIAVVAAFGRHPLNSVLLFVCGALALLSSREAYKVRLAGPSAPRPARPVLLINPHSGAGKAARFHLAEEARRRGIEAIDIHTGDQLKPLARDAVARGADALAVAGGDGSQAVVATIAAEHHLPFACIPAGTRNHFALDLGVDRDDVIGALDALVDGMVRWVDLAEVNGRVFVNNVSLGLYAEAVQRPSYRQAKLRTLLEVSPPADGPPAVLISNNAYRLGARVGAGTRPTLEDGVLGIIVVERRAGSGPGVPLVVRESAATDYTFDATGLIRAAIDGEAATLQGPLRFRSRPRALEVRISRSHSGVSPSASSPRRATEIPGVLLRLAFGRA